MSHIKHKYKELAKKYHPDKNKGKSEEESLEIRKKFYAIQAAFESIKEEKGTSFKSAGDDLDEARLDLVGPIIGTCLTIGIYLSVLYAIYYSVYFFAGFFLFRTCAKKTGFICAKAYYQWLY